MTCKQSDNLILIRKEYIYVFIFPLIRDYYQKEIFVFLIFNFIISDRFIVYCEKLGRMETYPWTVI